MARMSLDDRARRDQRLYDLAALLGWSVRETFAALIDVWEICYDRVTDVLPEIMVNNRVFREAPPNTPVDFDFAGKMVQVGYARKHAAPRMIVIAGAKKHIRYLREQSKRGMVGGQKSGESRRKHTKRALPEVEAIRKPLPLVPDLDLATAPDRSDRERSDRLPTTAGAGSPDLSPESASPVSQIPEPDPPRQAPRLRVVGAQDELVREVGVFHAQEFQRVKAALKSGSIGPDAGGPHEQLEELLAVIAPGTARTKCLHAIAVQAADALRKRTLQNFGAGMWKLKNFEKALTFDPLEIAGKPKATVQARLPLIPDPRTAELKDANPRDPPQYVTSDDPEARAMIQDYDSTIAEIVRKSRPPPTT